MEGGFKEKLPEIEKCGSLIFGSSQWKLKTFFSLFTMPEMKLQIPLNTFDTVFLMQFKTFVIVLLMALNAVEIPFFTVFTTVMIVVLMPFQTVETTVFMAFITVLTAVFIAFQAVVIKVWIAVTTVVITVFMAFHTVVTTVFITFRTVSMIRLHLCGMQARDPVDMMILNGDLGMCSVSQHVHRRGSCAEITCMKKTGMRRISSAVLWATYSDLQWRRLPQLSLLQAEQRVSVQDVEQFSQVSFLNSLPILR